MKRQSTCPKFFYQKDKLVRADRNGQTRSILRHASMAIAECRTDAPALLLATDQLGSVLSWEGGQVKPKRAYTVYEHDMSAEQETTLLGFNGDPIDPQAGGYLLGNGYRPDQPRLMRFTCPDTLSPFDKLGLNSYAYVQNAPVNATDPSGHFRLFAKTRQFGEQAKVIPGGAFAYVSKHPTLKNKRPITLNAHGSNGKLQGDWKTLNAEQVVRRTWRLVRASK